MLLVCSLGDAARADVQTVDLRLATLEELMNIEVTSASRREQRVDDVPAAVYVITRDEIRRSGLTSIPELLRLAPGVQVARINSNKWAVSVRGFNGRLYSNKLLVMIDGRSIYNPAFSTVLWDTEDLLIEDIDHIEVIRGSGRSDVGRQCRQRRHQHHHPLLDTDTAAASRAWASAPSTRATRHFATAARSAACTIGCSHRARHTATLSPRQDVSANDSWRSVTTGFRTDWSRHA